MWGRGCGVWRVPAGMEIPGGGGFKQKCPPWVGCIDIFWNYKICGSKNCSIWTQSWIIIVEKVTKKQSWHSLQDQGSAAISLAKPLHWHIYWLTQIESVGIWIYMNVLNYVGRKCYWYTFTKHRGRFYILFFWEILKGSATDYSQWSPTLTTYPLSSQLRLTCPHNSLLCWVYSLQLQALLAPGLLSTKDRFRR